MNKKQFTKEMVKDYAEKLLIGLTEEETNMVLEEFSIIDEDINKINNIEGLENIEPMTHCLDRYIEELLTGKLADIFNGMPNIAMDIAVCKMVTKYPKEKEWFLRVYRQPIYENLKCENNRPTKAFEWLTGMKPKFIIAEDGFKDKLSNHKEESIALLKKLSQLSPKDYSFIAMTGNQKAATIPKWHCMPVMFVKDGVELKDKRTDQGYKFTYENFIDRFKSLVGIIWNDYK